MGVCGTQKYIGGTHIRGAHVRGAHILMAERHTHTHIRDICVYITTIASIYS